MNMTKTAGILRRAADVLGEKGWCQGKLEDDNGSVCAMGALEYAQNEMMPLPHFETDDYFALIDDRISVNAVAVGAMAEVLDIPLIEEDGLPGNPIPDWNDAADRTAEDVILAMKRAAQRIEDERESTDPC